VSDNFLGQVESARKLAQQHIADEKKKLAEQYFTPERVSRIMAGMFSVYKADTLSLLDPCCGVGNLAAAVISRAQAVGESIVSTLVEKDPYLVELTESNFSTVKNVNIVCDDFFSFLSRTNRQYDRIILNPPYSKIRSGSDISKFCRSFLRYSENNLYSAFVACCLRLLSQKGELVAIVPRSFCNGPMFRAFRASVVSDFSISEIYLFESRKVFSEAGVLQELVIVKISRAKSDFVKISHEDSKGDIDVTAVSTANILFPADENHVIHIPVALGDDELLAKMSKFCHILLSLGLRASTGKVVDFRSGKWLRKGKSDQTARLLYQDVVHADRTVQPSAAVGGKPRFIKICAGSASLLVPRANYVLVRRISFKESRSRIVCSTLLEDAIEEDVVGIENHLNYIWGESVTLGQRLSRALCAYLSTPSVDSYIRRFSGHTQINATDLNSLPIPSLVELEDFGRSIFALDLLAAALLAEKRFFPKDAKFRKQVPTAKVARQEELVK
jgi:adenine-specific DNA-methyltransferase